MHCRSEHSHGACIARVRPSSGCSRSTDTPRASRCGSVASVLFVITAIAGTPSACRVSKVSRGATRRRGRDCVVDRRARRLPAQRRRILTHPAPTPPTRRRRRRRPPPLAVAQLRSPRELRRRHERADDDTGRLGGPPRVRRHRAVHRLVVRTGRGQMVHPGDPEEAGGLGGLRAATNTLGCMRICGRYRWNSTRASYHLGARPVCRIARGSRPTAEQQNGRLTLRVATEMRRPAAVGGCAKRHRRKIPAPSDGKSL